MKKTKINITESKFRKNVEELFDKMEELGICIEHMGSNGFRIYDNEGHDVMIKDADDLSPIHVLPSFFEYRLINRKSENSDYELEYD